MISPQDCGINEERDIPVSPLDESLQATSIYRIAMSLWQQSNCPAAGQSGRRHFGFRLAARSRKECVLVSLGCSLTKRPESATSKSIVTAFALQSHGKGRLEPYL